MTKPVLAFSEKSRRQWNSPLAPKAVELLISLGFEPNGSAKPTRSVPGLLAEAFIHQGKRVYCVLFAEHHEPWVEMFSFYDGQKKAFGVTSGQAPVVGSDTFLDAYLACEVFPCLPAEHLLATLETKRPKRPSVPKAIRLPEIYDTLCRQGQQAMEQSVEFKTTKSGKHVPQFLGRSVHIPSRPAGSSELEDA